MKKIAVFGCKSTTTFLLNSLLEKDINVDYVITITPESGEKNQVADYVDLTSCAALSEVKIYQAKRYDLKSEEDRIFFSGQGFDIAFVVGWQRLVPSEVLETFSVGVFGMHGSTDDLPLGRGRSPMNWALIEQRNHFFTNIFKYDPGVDSGDILDTFTFSIQGSDTIETMHYKNVLAMKHLIMKNISTLMYEELPLKRQKNIEPTYYPKRSPNDSLIDWEKDVFQIESFIRAVAKPFNGAFSFIDGQKIILWRASIFETDLVDYGFRDSKWGGIVEVFPSGKFLVKCRGGLLIIHDYETDVVINNKMIIDSSRDDLPVFELNKFGYHDLDLNQ